MSTRPAFEVPLELQRRCWDYGRLAYSERDHPSVQRSLSVSSHGAEDNLVLQGLAKMAECACCSLLGVSIEALNWTGLPDSGSDLVFRGKRIDVKHTERGSRLIWPIRKRELFDSKSFDLLVLMKGGPPHFVFTMFGFISKARFKRQLQVSDGSEGLTVGTWFVDEALLANPLRLLGGFVGFDSLGRFLHYCHCGKWGDYGVDVSLRNGRLGTWFCSEHKGERDESASRRAEDRPERGADASAARSEGESRVSEGEERRQSVERQSQEPESDAKGQMTLL